MSYSTALSSAAHGFLVITPEDGTVEVDAHYLVPDTPTCTYAATSAVGDDLPEAERTSPRHGRFSSVTVSAGALLAYRRTA